MKKIIILIIALIFISGCDIKYNLNISKNLEFKEVITINGNIKKEFGNIGDTDVKKYFFEMTPYYKDYKLTTNDANNGNFNVIFESKVAGKEKFLKLESLSRLYYYSKIYLNDNNNYVFNLSTKKRNNENEDYDYELTEFDALTISIYSEKKIINSNADRKVFNNYIWEMKDSKYKDIYFELTDENDFIVRPIYFVIIGIIIIGVPVFLLIRKSKKNNAI
jgi:hypothetical protein